MRQLSPPSRIPVSSPFYSPSDLRHHKQYCAQYSDRHLTHEILPSCREQAAPMAHCQHSETLDENTITPKDFSARKGPLVAGLKIGMERYVANGQKNDQQIRGNLLVVFYPSGNFEAELFPDHAFCGCTNLAITKPPKNQPIPA